VPPPPPPPPPLPPVPPPPTPPPPVPKAVRCVDAIVTAEEHSADALESPLPPYPPPPPPLPSTAASPAVDTSTESSPDAQQHQNEDYVLIDALQAMSDVGSASASPSSAAAATEPVGKPKLSPPRQGQSRASWKAGRALEVSSSALEKSFLEARSGLSHVELRSGTSTGGDIKTGGHGSDAKREEVTVFERFDPTAWPAPVVPKRPPPPKKVTFTPPSSDPTAQIRWYGHQRVVIRQPTGSGQK
jgi:hypothetical protein